VRTALKSAFRGCESIDGRDSSHSCATVTSAGARSLFLPPASQSGNLTHASLTTVAPWLSSKLRAHFHSLGMSAANLFYVKLLWMSFRSRAWSSFFTSFVTLQVLLFPPYRPLSFFSKITCRGCCKTVEHVSAISGKLQW
jgi:hypothetical protein